MAELIRAKDYAKQGGGFLVMADDSVKRVYGVRIERAPWGWIRRVVIELDGEQRYFAANDLLRVTYCVTNARRPVQADREPPILEANNDRPPGADGPLSKRQLVRRPAKTNHKETP